MLKMTIKTSANFDGNMTIAVTVQAVSVVQKTGIIRRCLAGRHRLVVLARKLLGNFGTLHREVNRGQALILARSCCLDHLLAAASNRRAKCRKDLVVEWCCSTGDTDSDKTLAADLVLENP